MTNAELEELVHLLMMCGIMDKTATESGNVTNDEWLRMKSLISKYQEEKEQPETNGDLISRSVLKKALREAHINMELTFGIASYGCVMNIIDNAPAVDISKEVWNMSNELLNKRLSYLERPQSEFVELLNDRIEERVCKYCQMNKHCELCEISRVFQIIALTDKEMKEGAE